MNRSVAILSTLAMRMLTFCHIIPYYHHQTFQTIKNRCHFPQTFHTNPSKLYPCKIPTVNTETLIVYSSLNKKLTSCVVLNSRRGKNDSLSRENVSPKRLKKNTFNALNYYTTILGETTRENFQNVFFYSRDHRYE